ELLTEESIKGELEKREEFKNNSEAIKEAITKIDGIKDEVQKMKEELHAFEEQKDELLRSIDVAKVNTLTNSEIDKMKSITPSEFLQYSPKERLRFVTV
ncbi:MAG: hypothetical protein LBD88_04310, partial [Candidatus Peribacteria bacterium]|nr:hypothetical protein [Candidatus Peribacteria bacterium]